MRAQAQYMHVMQTSTSHRSRLPVAQHKKLLQVRVACRSEEACVTATLKGDDRGSKQLNGVVQAGILLGVQEAVAYEK